MNSLFVANFLKNLPNKAQLVILKKAVTEQTIITVIDYCAYSYISQRLAVSWLEQGMQRLGHGHRRRRRAYSRARCSARRGRWRQSPRGVCLQRGLPGRICRPDHH